MIAVPGMPGYTRPANAVPGVVQSLKRLLEQSRKLGRLPRFQKAVAG